MLRTLVLFAAVGSATAASYDAPAIVERMVQADNGRLAALSGYTAIRHYRFENKRQHQQAEVVVRMLCSGDGVKTFELLSESGSGFLRNHIIRKMIETESEASQKGERKQSRIIPENYDFQLVGREISEGRDNFLLDITPKKPSKFSVRGRIWVDAEDFAIARIEGEPAKNPSFWIGSVKVVQRYQRTGQFWLPALNHSVAQARIFGTTELVIESSDYVTSVRDGYAAASPRSTVNE